VVEIDEKSSHNVAGFNTIWWWVVIVAYFFVASLYISPIKTSVLIL